MDALSRAPSAQAGTAVYDQLNRPRRPGPLKLPHHIKVASIGRVGILS